MAPYTLSLIVAAVVALIILLLAAAIVWEIFTGRLNLAYLLSEPAQLGGDGLPKASLSRFQFLIFTFVIAGLYLILSIEAGTLIDVPSGALILLGISGGSYIVSKATSASAKQTPPDANDTPQVRGRRRGPAVPPAQPAPPGQPVP